MKRGELVVLVFVIYTIILVSVVSASTVYIEKDVFYYSKNKTVQSSGEGVKTFSINSNHEANIVTIPIIITLDSKESLDKIISFLNINRYKIQI